jgi:hypothetical protein
MLLHWWFSVGTKRMATYQPEMTRGSDFEHSNLISQVPSASSPGRGERSLLFDRR